LISSVIGNRPYFSLALNRIGDQINIDETLRENIVFDFGRSDVHGLICSGQAKLQGHGQELSDEQGQGMQLRQRLRLRQDVR
jgi:hypothetical protein